MSSSFDLPRLNADSLKKIREVRVMTGRQSGRQVVNPKGRPVSRLARSRLARDVPAPCLA
jgi:hypothetical protein